MAFEGLADKLQGVFKKLSGRGKLNEKDVKEAMREVKLALLEADVNFKVVRDFVKTVSERAIGNEVLESLTPGQQVIKIVNEELTALMGAEQTKLNISPKPPSVYMMVGLQGAGKTTMSGKLANYLRDKQNKRPLLVACDIYRPAAIKQLQVLGEKTNIPVFEKGQQNPVQTAKEAIAYAEHMNFDIVIIDTAGRLHIDENMMDELKQVQSEVNPTEVLLVVDAMTGQDAVNVAEQFDAKLDVTGVILTKLDGDTRGGAAISVKAVTGKPIKFAGTGEKIEHIEPFHPDRMANRILGMGDVLTLIEKAQENFDEKQGHELMQKMRKNQFTMEDFLAQMQQIKSMGPMQDILKMLPGASKLGDVDIDEKAMGRTEAIMLSMTRQERLNPEIIKASRRKRIAAGSGVTVQEVNKLLNQFESMKKMMKQMGGTKGKRKKRLGGMGGMNFPF